MKIILAESILILPFFRENSVTNRYFREKTLVLQSFTFLTFHLCN